MAAGTISDIVRTMCPGVATSLVDTRVSLACRQFFSDTELWTDTIETDTVASQADYDLSALIGTGLEIRRILSVAVGLETDVVPQGWYALKNGTLSFVGVVPDEAEDMFVEVVLVPKPTLDVTDEHFDATGFAAATAEHVFEIAEYALYLLRDMADVPWSNERWAQKHLQNYMSEVSRLRAQTLNKNTSAPSFVRPAFFA